MTIKEEELDIVKSLEETAANSYEDGYYEGWKKGIDELRDAMIPLLVFQDKKVIENKAERLKEQGCICVNEATSQHCPIHGMKEQG